MPVNKICSSLIMLMFLLQRLPNREPPPPGGIVGPLRGATVVYMRGIFILKEIRAQEKTIFW
jgi:hypothetical protein